MAVYRLPPVAQFQQPRVNTDQRSVDSPIPRPPDGLPEFFWLRRRPDYEADQQPRRLLDSSVTASVDSPIPNSVPVELTLRSRWPYPTVRGLPVDILAPAVVADNPTGAPYQIAGLYVRPVNAAYWQNRVEVDTSISQSVDSPPVRLAGQWTPTAKFVQGHQAVPLPVDITNLVTTPDNPTGAPFTFWIPRPPAWEQWLQARKIDTTATQSVDSPTGFLIQPPARRDLSLIPWHQAAPGVLSGPDQPPPPVLQAAAYMRAAADRQAFQKKYSAIPLVVVESPPTQGPFQPAIYRRPVPPTPYRLPTVGVLVTPPSLSLIGRTRSVRIASATVAATLTSATGTGSITSATTTEELP